MSTFTATLDSIAFELSQLCEDYTDHDDEELYAFKMHQLLLDLPTPAEPFHTEVIMRLKDWRDARLIPAEIFDSQRRRIMTSARSGASSSSAAAPADTLSPGKSIDNSMSEESENFLVDERGDLMESHAPAQPVPVLAGADGALST